MVQPGDACSALSRLIRRPHRAGFLAVICVLAMAMPAWSPAWSEEERPRSPLPQVAAAAPAAPDVVVAAPAVVTIVKPPDARAEQSSDQQRRVLMLLLMNSAGPVRPFGNLGR